MQRETSPCLSLWPQLHLYSLHTPWRPHSRTMPGSLDTPLAHASVPLKKGMLHEHAVCVVGQSSIHARAPCFTECCALVVWKVYVILTLNLCFLSDVPRNKGAWTRTERINNNMYLTLLLFIYPWNAPWMQHIVEVVVEGQRNSKQGTCIKSIVEAAGSQAAWEATLSYWVWVGFRCKRKTVVL